MKKNIVFFDDSDEVDIYAEELRKHEFEVKIYRFADSLLCLFRDGRQPIDLLISEMIVKESPSNNFDGKRKHLEENCAKLLVDELGDDDVQKIILTAWAGSPKIHNSYIHHLFQEASKDPRFFKVLRKKVEQAHGHEYLETKNDISPAQLVRIVKKALKEADLKKTVEEHLAFCEE